MPGSDHDSFEFEPDFSDDELLATIFGDAANDPDGPDAGDGDPDAAESHRGAFGDFGATSSAFIDRSFREKIVLVGVSFPPFDDDLVEEHLDELARLIDTAGADEVGRVVQRRQSPDAATFIGSGKAQEIKEMAIAFDCDTVVFDDELTPAQQFNLEKILGRTAIDRTAVILDIFAQNASSLEGKAQVELAQLKYRLPRLRGKGRSLSQQGGGIGTRGPGETQLEVDRRRLVRRIHKLEEQLRGITHVRDTQRKARRRSLLRNVVIVGYTNAGKSTLLNRLTDSGVLVEDRLFATLDPTTRRLQLPGGESVLMTDTVGFVRKLPHQLVEAFKSTLEVVNDADLLVHVVDGSAVDPQAEIEAVRDVLREIDADGLPELLVFNKCDASEESARLAERFEGAVAISAVTGEGVEALLATIGDRLRALVAPVDLEIPYDRGDLIAAVHRSGEVLSETPGEHSMRMRARLEASEVGRFEQYQVPPGVPAAELN
ncbi:MAG TPA: GTPase HflX [Microthrixaceae bacterium]|jgi:GTP-binding protein HflX|nr:GTPase HflX [Microthrixaceae bacterium]